jgi:hypothetical protein
MKKVFILMSALIMLSFMACGPSQEEQERQKRIDDSLMEPERNNALENANNIIADTTTANDSVAKKDTKTKK